MKRYALSHLSDDVLLRDLAAVVARERSATAEVLAHIAEVDARTHKTKAEIERLLAERFPTSDLLTWMAVSPSAPDRVAGQLAPAQVEETRQPVPERAVETVQPVPAHGDARPRVTQLSSKSVGLQVTLDQRTHEKLRHAQALLGHQIPSGDLARLIDRVLDLAIAQLEKQKFAATSRPRRGQCRDMNDPRRIPAHVRRAVWERDQGQCTFVSETGHRCPARKPLEFDHIQEVARGGEATVEGIRLRCRAHNQYQAERTFGAEFMRHKRIAAAEARVAAKAHGTREQVAAAARAQAVAAEHVAAPERESERDVVPWLRALGFSAAEARRAAVRCEAMPDAPLEERVRVALTCLRVRGTRVTPAGEGPVQAVSLAG